MSERSMPKVSARSGFAWMALSQATGFILSFCGSVLIARLLTPREMGIYAIAAATVGILAVLRSTGLNNFLIREPNLNYPIIATTFTINMILAILSSLIIMGAGIISGRGFGDVGVEQVLWVLAISSLLSVFEFLPAALLERAGRFREMSAINLLKSFVNTLITVTLAAQGYSFMSIAWGNLAGASFAAISMSLIVIPFPKFCLSLSEWKPVSKFAIQMMTLGVIGSISERLFDILLGRLAGLSALGLYARASGLNGLLWDNLHMLIGRVVFIDFSERRRQGLSFRDPYLQIYSIITALLWPAFAGLSILSGPVILNLYGEKWLESAAPLSLLTISGMVYTTATMTWELYIIRGEVRAQIRFQITRTIFGLIIFTLGCINGLSWAAASKIGDALVTVFITRQDVQRMTDTYSRDYLPILAQSFALTVLGCGPAFLLMLCSSWSPHTDIKLVLTSVFVGAALWVAGLWLLKHPLFVEPLRSLNKSRGFLPC